MLENLEIRSKNTREVIGLVDGANSILWHSVYFGVGDFEIYISATKQYLELLQHGNYIARQDDSEIGIIENVQIINSIQDGMMLIASGRFAKSILDRRQIYNLSGTTNTPTILRGNVEVNIRKLVSDNAINCTFDSARNIPILELGQLSNIPYVIVDENGNATQKQVSYDNLLTYSDSVLEEYDLGSIITLNNTSGQLLYTVYEGVDRSINNVDGNSPVIFSQEYDNLSESNYSYDLSQKKTTALIGGEGEGLERFYSLLSGSEQGMERRETWVDASSLNRTYKDENNEEKAYTDQEYTAMLHAQGKQSLAMLKPIETFDGSILINGGIWKLNRDYRLGDIVTIEDKRINKYANVRITEILESQDENGYTAEITYKNI